MEVVDEITGIVFKTMFIITIVCTVLLMALIIEIIIYRISLPLKRGQKAVKELSSGNADLTIRLPEKGSDEFAVLSKNKNKFIELLQGIVMELNKAQASIVEVSRSLGSNAQDSASATAQILANIAGVRKQSENQSVAVGNTSDVLHNSAETVASLSRLIDGQAAGITQSSAAIEEMLGNISAVSTSVGKMSSSFNALGGTIEEGKSKLINVDQKVQEISEQSKMLMQASGIIAQIASQTNLLAMNASIEQVVSLSGESQTAFGDIVSNLASTYTIIKEIDSAMSEQEMASRQILEALGDMKNQSVQVRDQSAEMSVGINKATTEMQTLSEISSTILGSMDEMATGAQQISNAAQNVSELAIQTKGDVDVMDEKPGLFKV